MRLAQVTGLSGVGIVSEIHESTSVQALQDFLNARGIEARAVEALSSWVTIGISYDGTNFVVPELPDPPDSVEPTPASVDVIAQELDYLRQQSINHYISHWGEVSKTEMWPILDAEMVRASNDSNVISANYPALTGFLVASGFSNPSSELINTTIANLKSNKNAHVQFLRKGELRRQYLVAQYSALTDEQKLSWSSAERWTELEAAE